jgi:dGTPase
MEPDPLKSRRAPLTGRERSDMRSPYAIDVDRILHSKAYTRYIDKTQVFYLLKNDHVSHRVLHVQIVSRVARTLALKLGLDLDLVEAAALGHDLGHAPFGHDGEAYLAELCQESGLGLFVHAAMSLRVLEALEKGGKGLGLTLAVLDAILCHDGESDYATLSPDASDPSFAELDRRLAVRTADPLAIVRPMTREGCLVRLCDSISYVGRDLEDAIEIGLVSRGDVPEEIREVLGASNGTIVYRLVEDLLANCQGDKVAFSPKVANALTSLKNFNRKNIYLNPRVKTEAPKIKRLYRILFEAFLSDFEKGPSLPAAVQFLSGLSDDYKRGASPAEKARDLIAGMTDEYFLRQATAMLLPKWSLDRFN